MIIRAIQGFLVEEGRPDFEFTLDGQKIIVTGDT
jgi:hypothetical protein